MKVGPKLLKGKDHNKNTQEEQPNFTRTTNDRHHAGKKFNDSNTFIAQALARVKFYVPLMEIIKFPEYGNEAFKLISKVGNHKE